MNRSTTLSPTPAMRRALDSVLFLALAGGYLAWLLSSVETLGYARDEGFYFASADSYLKWFQLLVDAPDKAILQKNVDRYWKVNHEHPALIKSLFGLSRYWLHDRLGWFAEPGTAYRFVGMAFASGTVGLIYLWGRQAINRTAGLLGALTFAFIPRVFYHAHLACFDIPVLSMWLLTTYAYWRSLGAVPELSRKHWAWITGLLYGLLLNTKHNSWLLPFALVAHALLVNHRQILEGLRARRLRVPVALWWMLLLGPLVFWCSWPWLWFNTQERLEEYVRFHTAHVYYNMEFLGHTYFKPPFPKTYAWLMTAATVPMITLLLSAIGVALFLGTGPLRRILVRVQQAGSHLQQVTPGKLDTSTQYLWLLCIVVCYAPWLSSTSPIFGGTKHWMTAYPYLCLFAGTGFAFFCSQLRQLIPRSWQHAPVEGAMACAALLGPLTMTANAHPWALTFYTPVVGGAPGAASLGLNRSFWGYSTGAVQQNINALAKKNGRVFIHDTALSSWQMLERDGRIRRALRPQLSPAGSQLAVYHHEQHMSRVEYQIWVDYGTVRPALVAGLDGVPVIWLYTKPKRK